MYDHVVGTEHHSEKKIWRKIWFVQAVLPSFFVRVVFVQPQKWWPMVVPLDHALLCAGRLLQEKFHLEHGVPTDRRTSCGFLGDFPWGFCHIAWVGDIPWENRLKIFHGNSYTMLFERENPRSMEIWWDLKWFAIRWFKLLHIGTMGETWIFNGDTIQGEKHL